MKSGLDLEPAEIQNVMRGILSGSANTEGIKEFLLTLKEKGETAEEVGALVAEMYEHSVSFLLIGNSLFLRFFHGDLSLN